MPRPTAAQLSYGSVTVVFSALAMLLLSGTGSLAGVAVVCTTALALGLLVAVTVPLPTRTGGARSAGTTASAPAGVRTPQPGGGAPARVPAARAAERAGQHSLRR
ncbi:hypothetical protein [Streptomyces fulvorobeus]|uniref:Uncharacterized protein n=1 Tax=Streptomyces fulvorobeus TaxID=284028 RepID=A0A7J0C4K8_9ACTN|nr:hypothetical protein [Streptomyces fulvorobeus]NYE41072.1 hypothetical protein [Streptomyces fulvorobeus]GFM97400.1 hypothetical protein Sfulv_22110 [Streptomyces fulvorobeus]